MLDQIETVGHLPCSLIITIMGQFPNRRRMLPLALLVPSMCSTPYLLAWRVMHTEISMPSMQRGELSVVQQVIGENEAFYLCGSLLSSVRVSNKDFWRAASQPNPEACLTIYEARRLAMAHFSSSAH
jgi:hypothetical protein